MPAPEWEYSPLETVEAPHFYNAVGRTGIKYGKHFRMVQRTNIFPDTSALLRCAFCVHAGPLQTGAGADSTKTLDFIHN